MRSIFLVITFAFISYVNAQDLQTLTRIESDLKELNPLLSEGKTSGDINHILPSAAVTIGTGSISGTVYKKDQTIFDGSASVYLYNEFGYRINTTSTNGYKQYAFENLPPGKYLLFASSFPHYKGQYYDKTEDLQKSKWISVEDTAVTDIDFYLEKYTGSLSGFLKDLNNNPIGKCYVLISGRWGGYSTSTDSSGKYVFRNLPPGKYYIYAKSISSGNYLSQWYNNAETEEDAEPIDVFENAETENINFVLTPGAIIKGKIILSDYYGQYYPFKINLYKDGNYVLGKSPDSLGNFTLTGIAKGSYKLEYVSNASENLTSGWYSESFSEQDALTISATPPDTINNIIIVPKKGGLITGTLLTPSVRAESYDILLIDKDKKVFTNFSYLFDLYHQKYTLGKIPSGKYKLRIQQQDYVEEWYNNKNSEEEADWITISAPDTVKEINFTFDHGCTIEGVIYDPEGKPLTERCGINCRNLTGGLSKSTYSDNGIYQIKGLKPGDKYTLDIYYNGQNSYANPIYRDTITISDQTLTINFHLKQKGILQGFINDAAGQRINGSAQDISYYLFDAETGDHTYNDYITLQGGYFFSPMLGKYKMSFLSSDLSDSIAVTYYGGGNSFDDPSSLVINLSTTEALTLNNQNLETAAGSISGNITIKDSSNLNKRIFIYDEKGFLTKMAFTTEASYKISGLRPGNYYIGGYFGLKSVWYKDVRQNPQYLFSPKMKIPAGAVPVTIGYGETAGINFEIGDASDIEQPGSKPLKFQLEQNYPNPFNPETNITYHLPERSKVMLKIYNMLGREIETLIDQEQMPGTHSVNWNASHLSSGIYFCTLQTGGYRDTKKLLLLK